MECEREGIAGVQTSVWFPDDPARKALLQRWAIAFVWCAMDHVREDCDLGPPLQARPPLRNIGLLTRNHRFLTCVALSDSQETLQSSDSEVAQQRATVQLSLFAS